METSEELHEFLNEILEDPYLNQRRLLGIAWSHWRLNDGSLPNNSPVFPVSIESDLELYGYSLLRAGLSLLEVEGHSKLTRKAFEFAAITFESLIRNIDTSDIESRFKRILSATSYHLAGFSASAYSIFSNITEETELTAGENAIRLLISRNIEGLRKAVEDRLTDENYMDKNLISNSDIESTDIDEILAEILNTEICRAFAYFDFALQTGERDLFKIARSILKKSVKISERIRNVPMWWICNICLFLLGDLWNHSLHKILPKSPKQGESPKYDINRLLFIGILFSRNRSEIEAWPSQTKAIKNATDISKNLVLTLPTSAGKTRIAEIATLTTLSNFNKVLIVTPLRALSAQTEKSFKKIFEPLGYNVSSLYGAQSNSEIDNQFLTSNDIVISTPEKLDFTLREDPTLLDEFKLIVLDEGHMIGPTEREIRFESLINRLLKRQDAAERRIICLSAVLPSGDELEDFSNWISMDTPNSSIHTDWRPTRQSFGYLVWGTNSARLTIDNKDEEQNLYFPNFVKKKSPIDRHKNPRPQSSKELTLFAAWEFVKIGKNTLIYIPRRAGVESYGSEVIKLVQQGYLEKLDGNFTKKSQKLIEQAVKVGEEWLGKSHPSVECLKIGIGVHHGRLPDPFRRELETVISEVGLNVIITSPTLAQGLNLNASVLLIPELKRMGKLIPVTEFANVTGRAGRAFVDVEGQNICVIYEKDKRKVQWKQRDWSTLINNSKTKSIRSGLIQIVYKILFLIAKDNRFNKYKNNDQFWENLVNSSDIWDNLSNQTIAPELQTTKNGNPTKIGPEEISSDILLENLDVSILSMVETLDVEVDKLKEELAKSLEGTLWSRQIINTKEIDKKLRKLCEILLIGRAEFIWRNSTESDRKGYFRLGVGFSTGIKIESQFENLCMLIDQADLATISNDTVTLVDSLTNLAKILFELRPFKPDNIPDNWETIIEKWIVGSSIAGFKTDELKFIEEALVYKLVWAIEAIRLKRIDNEELLGIPPENGGGGAAASLETGVPNFSMSMLIRAGFSSRIGAKKAVEQTEATFTKLKELKNWLNSEHVTSLSAEEDWPTPESAELWVNFKNRFSKSIRKEWTIEEEKITLDLQDELESGFYRIHPHPTSDNKILLVSPDFQETATISDHIENFDKELISGQFEKSSNTLKITRLGTKDANIRPIF